MPKLNSQEVVLFGLMVMITPFPRWGSLRPQGDEPTVLKKPDMVVYVCDLGGRDMRILGSLVIPGQ